MYCVYSRYTKVVPTGDFSQCWETTVIFIVSIVGIQRWSLQVISPKSQCWETTVIFIVSIVGKQSWSLQVISPSPSVGKLLWYLFQSIVGIQRWSLQMILPSPSVGNLLWYLLCLLLVYKGGPYKWFHQVPVLGNYCDIYFVYYR